MEQKIDNIEQFEKIIKLKNEKPKEYKKFLKDFEEVFSDLGAAIFRGVALAHEKSHVVKTTTGTDDEADTEEDDYDDTAHQTYY